MDINQLRGAVAGQQAAGQQFAVDLAELLSQQSDIRNTQASLVTADSRGNTPEMIRQAGIAGLQAQERTLAISKALGLSPDGVGDLQYRLAEQQRQATEASIEQGKKIAQMESVGLTDNPLEYLINQWMLPDEYTKFDGLVASADSAAKHIQNLQTSTTNVSRTSDLIQEKITQQTIQDQVTASQNEMERVKLEYKLKNIDDTARYTERLFSLNKDQLNMAMQLYQVEATDEQRKIMREMRMEELKAKREKAEEEVIRQQSIVDSINRTRIKNGKDPVDKSIFTKGLFESKQLQKEWETGIDIESGNAVLGSPSEVEAAILKGMPAISDSHNLVANTVLAVVKSVRAGGAKKEAIDGQAAADISKKIEDWERGVGTVNGTNPLQILTTGALDKQKAVADSAAWKIYRSMNTADEHLNADDVISKLLPAVRERKISVDNVADLLIQAGGTSMMENTKLTDLMYLTGQKQKNLYVPITVGTKMGSLVTDLLRTKTAGDIATRTVQGIPVLGIQETKSVNLVPSSRETIKQAILYRLGE